jgi:hypothetical protein
MNPTAPNAEAVSEEVAVPLPKVTSNFHDYTPPFDVAAVVEKMLESVPSKYLVGLSEVVLTNTSGLPRKLRRSMTKSRKRRLRTAEARGLYHPKWNNRPAWIEIYVDNLLRTWDRGWWLKFGFVRDTAVSDVLFHEIGHHVHFAIKPEYRETEDVADIWKVRFQQGYNAKRFPLISRIVRLVMFIFGPLYSRIAQKGFKWEVQKGWMSRAEFEYRTRKKGSTK